eukprot:Phypoly_transcript_04364.p1 GENE.Phypoly_transcript_04364~~Phypoly_transcript_04364.p1  ORF type:complete len:629 (+),score=80.25 Phypoly_transcript_04364:247-2133(+)
MWTLSTFFLLGCLLLSSANAQKWIGGSNTTDHSGTYNNSLGSLNVIGSRAEMSCWADQHGAYIFGGLGYGNDTLMELGLLSDLWRLDTGVWWFVNGSTLPEAPSQYDPIFGAVHPGCRRNAVHWKVHDQLWLFGGMGIDSMLEEGVLNDIWVYNISSGLWQWKGGSRLIDVPPQYNATIPIPPLNVTILPNPGSRECSFTWLVHGENGTEDILWLFGGIAEEEMYHSDVWTYNMTSNAWAWVAGSNLTNGGSQYNASAPGSVTPSPRACGASWVGEDGNLYLFGGHEFNETTEIMTLLNDVWQFNTTSNQWKVIQQPTPTGIYNNTINDRPAGRFSPSFTTDGRGNLYLFGGKTPLFEEAADTMNDLWFYNTSANQWKWLLGAATPNSPGNYNTTTRIGVPAARASACLWIVENQLYLFGGSNSSEEDFGYWNDLWVLVDEVHPPPPPTPSPTLPPASGNSTTLTTEGSTGNQTTSSSTSGTGVPTTGATSTSGPFNSTTGSTYNSTTSSLTSGSTSSTSTNSTTTGPNNSTTGWPLTSGWPMTSGWPVTSGWPSISTGITSGGNSTTHHPVNPGVIVGSVMGGGLTIGASIVGFMLWRGNLRVPNIFRRNEEEANELLPLNRKRALN